MRYVIVIIFVLVSSMAFAQDNWGEASLVYSVSWFELCEGLGGNGFDSPTITSNDSMLFFRYWCYQTDGIVYSIYENGEWGIPNAISGDIVGEYVYDPFFAESDSTVYYCSQNDTSGFGVYDIWATRLEGGIWSQAWNLGPVINTSGYESSPSMPLDVSKLYFLRDGMIMYSDIINGQFSQPIALPPLINSPLDESDPRISPDGTKLFFNRGPNPFQPCPMFVSYFQNGSWQEPIKLNANINYNEYIPQCAMIPGHNARPSFSNNGSKMYFWHFEPMGYACEPGNGIMVALLPDAIKEDNTFTPQNIAISAYPNPFNSEIKITVSGEFNQPFDLAIYNLAGQKVRTLSTEPDVIWDGRDVQGNSVSSGLYFVKAATVGNSAAIKITLLR